VKLLQREGISSPGSSTSHVPWTPGLPDSEREDLDTSAVRGVTWTEGRAVQTLHVGPYDQVGNTYARLETFARENGLATEGQATKSTSAIRGASLPSGLRRFFECR
jgi:hypothetical protein